MITSSQNSFIKNLIKLKSNKKLRDSQQLYYIEGDKEVELACKKEIQLEELIVCPERIKDKNSKDLLGQLRTHLTKDPVEVNAYLWDKISYRGTGASFIALAKKEEIPLSRLKTKGSAPFLVVVEGIEKPGNLGALFRTADAAGVDGILICDSDVDPWNPNVIRSSVGAFFSVPFFTLSSKEAINYLTKEKISIVNSRLQTSKNYLDVNFKQGVALVFGSEKSGLSPIWIDNGGISIRIPMLGEMDSLNLSCSAAILMYEVVRQRNDSTK